MHDTDNDGTITLEEYRHVSLTPVKKNAVLNISCRITGEVYNNLHSQSEERMICSVFSFEGDLQHT